MRLATFTSMLRPHGTLIGVEVAACVASKPFGTRITDQLIGI